MARRDIFKNITGPEAAPPERKATPGYASRGASKNMISSIGELADRAAKAEQLLEGGAVIDLDPALVDPSFVADRMEAHDEEDDIASIVEAIRDRGQDSPILVRPHPEKPGRYQSVFGHRRVKAALILQRPVRAVVKEVSDVDHVIAQGQENSARENLSFIERASFAQQLLERGYDRPTIQSALTVDAPMLTRMLSVTSRVPKRLVQSIGPAKTVGRDRWLDLAQLVERPALLAKAEEITADSTYVGSASDVRFDLIIDALKRAGRSARRDATKPTKSKWQPADKAVSAEFTDTGKAFALSLRSKDASRFGRYLASNLERLYGQFREEEGAEEKTERE
jgi:ParB family transcriptional regulator, chromosome partitioning protein